MSANPTLEPCPLCGTMNPNPGYIRDGAALNCSARDCTMSVRAFHPNAAEKCVEQWQRRPSPPSTAAIERAREIVLEIDGLLSNATDNPCNCGSDPEGACPRCNAWTGAFRDIERILVAALSASSVASGEVERVRAETVEQCAKVADGVAQKADRVEVINAFGVEAAQNTVKVCEGIAAAIRALATPSTSEGV